MPKSTKKRSKTNDKKSQKLEKRHVNFSMTESSDRISQLYKSHYKKILIKMILKTTYGTNIRYNYVVDTIEKYMDQGSDKDIIDAFAGMIKKPVSLYNETDNIKRAQRKWDNIKDHVPADLKIGAILDFGGNVGDAAYEFGQVLHLTKKDIYVIDVDEWAGEKWIPRDDITFVHYDKMDEMPSNKINVIFISHVLHHIKKNEFPKIIEMFKRILTKDGIIVLYEHNCGNDEFSTIIDLEHLMYDIAAKKITYDKFIKTFYAEYFTIAQWKNIFKKYFEEYFTIEKYSLDRSFYMFFRVK